MLSLLLLLSCNHTPKDVRSSDSLPALYPDYIGVTIPAGIAPLNFDLLSPYDWLDVSVKGSQGGEIHLNGKKVDFNIDQWRALTEKNKGGALSIVVSALSGGQWTQYKAFDIYVSADALDEWGLTYRRIAPGYEVYGHMGLYQRDLSTFSEQTIISNTYVPGACFNCHTENKTSADEYTFHIRGANSGTFISRGESQEVLQAVNDSIGGALVYPYWHPSGRYCAYSTNTTRQGFHAMRDERIEVFDQASDVLIYEPQSHTILRDSIVATPSHYETYPVFSPDGQTLYFCSSTAEPIPQRYKEVKYNICRIGFDAAKGCLTGEVDTIFNAREMGKSAIHPRPSYDGRYILFTLADYGCFPIWHKEADNWLLDLETLEAAPLETANSDDADSFHNWSKNSRWVVFTSRRGDGLYTRLYLCHIDEQGKAAKPFLLPQKSPKAFYDNMLYSYNTPDFTAAPVKLSARKVSKALLSPERAATEAKDMK